jgi:serine/threonine protein kinase
VTFSRFHDDFNISKPIDDEFSAPLFQRQEALLIQAGSCNNEEKATMIGRTVSHFQILEKIGQGGMGVVYKALDLDLKRSVALKILPPEYTADPKRKHRFIQEAQAASALNHRNIVTVYEIGSANGMDYIAMEFIDGTPLQRTIPSGGMEISHVLNFAIQIGEALAKAHQNGILHRDLKPGNIMVNQEGEIKIVDFGLSKLLPSEHFEESPSQDLTISQLTLPGTVLGTPHYMSPEQAEGKPVDSCSEIFSFGIVLYEMITGERPFEGPNISSVLFSIVNRPVPELSAKRSHLPAELIAIVEKALQKERRLRYQNMSEVVSDLRRLLLKIDTVTTYPKRKRPLF